MVKTLFAPLGLSYGSLFSAVALTQPDRVIVVSSRQASQNLTLVVEALAAIDCHCPIELHTLSDPFTGFLEGRQLAKKLAQKEATEHNIVCLTGGTTALQDAIKTIAIFTRADEMAVIDRRQIEEQRANPFIVGEMVKIPKLDLALER
ncbi:MAG: hypothetical protein QF569_25785 [Candidatus Poribacteria bacterium]|jgi:hypothetical protein|nr:hypothetical protein [Candidatus Poribacteria bacterium]